MKFIMYVLILFLPFLFMNCNDDKAGFVDYDLRELDATIRIPGLYKSVDGKEAGRIINKEYDSEFRDELSDYIIRNPDDQMLIDTLNPNKFIVVSAITPYVVIDNNSFYYTIDHERSISGSKQSNDATYYVGSKMGSVGTFKFIESMYRRAAGGRLRIGYTYLISSEAKTISISFYSPEKQDVRQYINTIRKK